MFRAWVEATFRSYKYFFSWSALGLNLTSKAAAMFKGRHELRNFCRLNRNVVFWSGYYTNLKFDWRQVKLQCVVMTLRMLPNRKALTPCISPLRKKDSPVASSTIYGIHVIWRRTRTQSSFGHRNDAPWCLQGGPGFYQRNAGISLGISHSLYFRNLLVLRQLYGLIKATTVAIAFVQRNPLIVKIAPVSASSSRPDSHWEQCRALLAAWRTILRVSSILQDNHNSLTTKKFPPNLKKCGPNQRQTQKQGNIGT